MKKKITTIEDLAAMVQRGFLETATKAQFEKLRSEMDNGFRSLRNEILEIKNEL